MTQTFEDIDGADAIVDDILIWGKDVTEHNKCIEQVLQRVRNINLKLNAEKSIVQTDEVTYKRHVLSSTGIKPQVKKELQRFMGIVNYLGKFIPNLSDVTQPLLHKETAWHWTEMQEKAFNEVKKRFSEENVISGELGRN